MGMRAGGWIVAMCVATGCGSPASTQSAEHQPAARGDVAEPAPPPAVSRAAPPAADVLEEPEYALDRMSRKVPLSGTAFCPPIELVTYAGTVVPFHKPLRITPPFLDHVKRFERIIYDAAIEVYGRPPSRIEHFGAFYCRRISTWPYLVSEHGLGNAIDIGGVRFDRLAAGEWPDAPSRWRARFSVGMSRHWNGTGKDREHARFLRLVAQRAIDQDGLFRVILGPAHPNHADHLHLDMAQARVVNVF